MFFFMTTENNVPALPNGTPRNPVMPLHAMKTAAPRKAASVTAKYTASFTFPIPMSDHHDDIRRFHDDTDSTTF